MFEVPTQTLFKYLNTGAQCHLRDTMIPIRPERADKTGSAGILPHLEQHLKALSQTTQRHLTLGNTITPFIDHR